MKETNPTTIEQALAMYKETVSPSRDAFVNVLNQIPEKEIIKHDDRRAIRSPYRWKLVAFAQVMALSFIVLISYPHYNVTPQEELAALDAGFSQVDRSIEDFEAGINNEDYTRMLVDYANL